MAIVYNNFVVQNLIVQCLPLIFIGTSVLQPFKFIKSETELTNLQTLKVNSNHLVSIVPTFQQLVQGICYCMHQLTIFKVMLKFKSK